MEQISQSGFVEHKTLSKTGQLWLHAFSGMHPKPALWGMDAFLKHAHLNYDSKLNKHQTTVQKNGN